MRSILEGNAEDFSCSWYFEKKDVDILKVKDILEKMYNGIHEVFYIYATFKNQHMCCYTSFHYQLIESDVRNILDKYDIIVDDIKISESRFSDSQDLLDEEKVEFGDYDNRKHNRRAGAMELYGSNHVFSTTYNSLFKELYRLEKKYLKWEDDIKYMCVLPVPNQNHVQVYVRSHEPKYMYDVTEYFSETYSQYTTESKLSGTEIIKKYFDFKDTNMELFEYGSLKE